MNISRFLCAAVFMFIALYLQFLFGETSGVWINFALGALISIALTLPFAQFLPLIFLYLLAINWQGWLSAELLVLVAPPLASFFLKNFLPWHRLINFSVFFFASAVSFYLIFAPKLIVQEPDIFFLDVIVGFVFGFIGYKIFNYVEKKS